MVKKNVALISHSSDLHGAERMLLNLASLLQKSGEFNPILILPKKGEISEIANAKGLHCFFSVEFPWYIFGNTPTYFHDIQTAANSIENILRNTLTDIAIINTSTNVAPMLATVKLNLPSIVWLHGVIDSSMIGSRDSQFVYWNENFLLHAATALIANSTWTAAFYASTLSDPGIIVIPNWTDTDILLEVSEKKYQTRTIVCLNTFEKNKGYPVLIKAVNILKKKGVDFNLELYGVGPELSNIQTLCKKHQLGQQVRFMGVTKDPQQAYDNASVVVNPSYVDSFGMTIIEAMARKTPVIATRSGGPEDIIVHGENGYLVDRGDSIGLAHYIEEIFENPLQARQMGEMAYLRVQENYSTQSTSNILIHTINSILESHRNYHSLATNHVFMLEWLSKEIAPLHLKEKMNLGKRPEHAVTRFFYPVSSLISPRYIQLIKSKLLRSSTIRELYKFGKLKSKQVNELINLLRKSQSFEEKLLPFFTELREDSLKLNSQLNGYVLTPSLPLNLIDFQEYQFEFKRANLKSTSVALTLDFPATTGIVGVEIVSPEEKIVTEAFIPLAGIEIHSPVLFEFDPIAGTQVGVWQVRVFVRNVDTIVKIYEWKKINLSRKELVSRKGFMRFSFEDDL